MNSLQAPLIRLLFICINSGVVNSLQVPQSRLLFMFKVMRLVANIARRIVKPETNHHSINHARHNRFVLVPDLEINVLFAIFWSKFQVNDLYKMKLINTEDYEHTVVLLRWRV